MTAGQTEDARLLSWESFKATFLDPGLGADVPVRGDPPITLFAEPHGTRIGLRIETDTPVASIPRGIRAITLTAQPSVLTITTDRAELYQPFYAFLLDISDRIQLEQSGAGEAIEEALARWRRLLAGTARMSQDAQLGLAGELWLLLRLLSVRGPSGLAAWTGPSGDAHDFRLGEAEIEVKTTTSELRTHIVSRLDQLEPSPESSLYILSLQLAAAGLGAGWTLPEQIAEARTLLRGQTGRIDQFDQALGGLGWSEEEADAYTARYKIRTPPTLVTVDEHCPRLVPADVNRILGERAGRLSDVQYRVDLEGMGAPEGSAAFDAVIPPPA